MISSPSTAFSRLAPLLVLLLAGGCGGADPAPVEEKGGAASLVDILAGRELTPQLRVELDGLMSINTERLTELAAAVSLEELSPVEADIRYADWLSEEASDRSLTPDQFRRLLAGAVGGRYR